jgi:hypothetical protein
MTWKLLSPQVSDEFRETLEVTLRRLLHNLVPHQCGLSWVVEPRVWLKSPGHLAKYVDPLEKLVRQLRTDFGKSAELHYAEKLLPRCVFLEHVRAEKESAIAWHYESKFEFDPDLADVLESMVRADLGRTTGLQGTLWSVRSPHGQTSLGIMYDWNTGHVITGEKEEYWTTILGLAKEVFEWAESSDLNWENCDTQEVYNSLMRKFSLIFVPTYRIDRGPYKLRLIWMGNAIIYALETWLMRGVKFDMKGSQCFGYKPNRGTERLAGWLSRVLISGDYKEYDLHLRRKILKKAWMALQRLYNLPEKLMCLLYAYNVYAPIARWVDGDLVLQTREGLQPSGTGAFVIINNIINNFYMAKALSHYLHVSISEIPNSDLWLVFGDDHVVPLPSGVSLQEWVRYFAQVYQHDVSGSVHCKGEFKFLRALYSKRYDQEPIVFSRFRNAACPEDSDITGRSKYDNALSLRAELLPFAKDASKGGSYMGLYKYMMNVFSPPPMDSLLMRDGLSDDEVAKLADRRDSYTLFFVKRSISVNESSDVFGSLL